MIRGKASVAPELRPEAGAQAADVAPVIGKSWPTSKYGTLVARFPTAVMAVSLIAPIILTIVGLGVNTTITVEASRFSASHTQAALDADDAASVASHWQQVSTYAPGSIFQSAINPDPTAIRQTATYRISLLFTCAVSAQASCPNLLSAEGIAYIHAVETAITNLQNYPATCWYNGLVGGYVNVNSPNCAPVNSLTQYYYASSVTSAPYFILDGAGPVMQTADAAMLNRLRLNPKLTWYTDESFATTGTTQSLRSQVILGTPLNLGFDSEQTLSNMDTLIAQMYHAAKKVPAPSFISLSIGGDRVVDALVLDIINSESNVKIPIIVFIVLVVLYVQTRSVVVSILGTVQILFTYLTSFSIFALAYNGQLPMLSFLSLFVVILWTLDGVMVIHSNFVHSGIMASSGRSNTLTVAQRISYVLRKSVKGVITAHLCALVCFALNTMSPVDELHDFAVLTTIMILVSAYLFIFFTPAMVLFHFFYFSKRRRNLQRQKEVMLRNGVRERDAGMQLLLTDLEMLKNVTGQARYQTLVDANKARLRDDKKSYDIFAKTNFYAQSFASEWNVKLKIMNERDALRRRDLLEQQQGNLDEFSEAPVDQSPQKHSPERNSDFGDGESPAPDLSVVRIQSKAFDAQNEALQEFADVNEHEVQLNAAAAASGVPAVYSSMRHVQPSSLIHIPPELLFRNPANVDFARRVVTQTIGSPQSTTVLSVTARAKNRSPSDEELDEEMVPVTGNVAEVEDFAAAVVANAPSLMRIPVVNESDSSFGEGRADTDELSRLEALACPFDNAWRRIAADVEILPGVGATKEVVGMLAQRVLTSLCSGAHAVDNVITRFDSPAQAGARIARTGFVDVAGDHQRIAIGTHDLDASHQVVEETPACGPCGAWWQRRGQVRRRWCCGRFGKRVDESREEKDRRLLGKKVKHEGYGRMEIFFNNTYTTMLHKVRRVIAIIFLFIASLAIWGASNLKPVTSYVQLLTDDTNQVLFSSALTTFAVDDVPCDFCGGAYRNADEYRKHTATTSLLCLNQGVPSSGLLNAYLDSCGVCNGNNACFDCAGVPNGPNTFDACGQCLPPNSTFFNQCQTCGLNSDNTAASCQFCARTRGIYGGGPNCSTACTDLTCPPQRGRCNRLTGVCECHQSATLGYFANNVSSGDKSCSVCSTGFFPVWSSITSTIACRLSCTSNDTAATTACGACSSSHLCTGCPHGLMGSSCITTDPSVCLHGVWSTIASSCTCFDGYSGTACRGQDVCNGRGTWSSATQGVVEGCTCIGQFVGKNCEYCRCANGGTCNDDGSCSCKPGWSGSQCRTCSTGCLSHGSCPVSMTPDQYPVAQCMGVFCTDIDLLLGLVCSQCLRPNQGYCASYQPPVAYYPTQNDMITACNLDVRGYCFWNYTASGCYLQMNFANQPTDKNYLCSACKGFWSGSDCMTCTAPADYACNADGTTTACDGNTYSSTDTVPVIDKCGVCGGDSACVGCDGVVGSGLVFDKCGVCGGNGDCSNGNAVVDINFYLNLYRSNAGVTPNFGTSAVGSSFDLADPGTMSAIQNICSQIQAQTTGAFTHALVRKCVVADYAKWVVVAANTAQYNMTVPSFPPTNVSGTAAQRLYLFYQFLNSTNRLAEVGFMTNDPTSPRFRAAYMQLQIRAISVGTSADDRIFSMNRFQILGESISRVLKVPVVQTSTTWTSAMTEQQSRSGMIWASCVGFFMFVTIINIVTCSLTGTLIAMFSVGFTVVVSLAFFAAAGFTMGATEQLGVSIMIGLAVEHTVHIIDTYLDTIQGSQSHLFARDVSRLQAVRTAMTRSATSILASGVGTVIVALTYVTSEVEPFRRTAQISIIVVCISVLTSLVFVGAFLTMAGPIATYRIITIAITLMLHWAAAWGIVVLALYLSKATAPDGSQAVH